MSTKLIFMPLYWGDYHADTSHLTTEQHGAYFLIMGAYWMRGAPEDDDEQLAAITRLPIERWRQHRQKLEPFFQIQDRRWTHKRIESELERARAKSEAKQTAAKAANDAKRAKSNANGSANGYAHGAQTDTHTDTHTAPHSESESELPLPSELESHPQRQGLAAGAAPQHPPLKTHLDPKGLVFETCAQWLAGQYDPPRKLSQIKNSLATAIRDAGGGSEGAAALLAAVFQCQREMPVGDPLRYIFGVIRKRNNGSRKDRGADTANYLFSVARKAEEVSAGRESDR